MSNSLHVVQKREKSSKELFGKCIILYTFTNDLLEQEILLLKIVISLEMS